MKKIALAVALVSAVALASSVAEAQGRGGGAAEAAAPGCAAGVAGAVVGPVAVECAAVAAEAGTVATAVAAGTAVATGRWWRWPRGGRGWYGYRGGWYGGWYGPSIGIGVGWPGYWGWGAYPYYPYTYAASYPVYGGYPVYSDAGASGSFISAPEASPSQNPANYWYYCADPAGYYPYVQSCPRGWMQVVPQNVPNSPVAQ